MGVDEVKDLVRRQPFEPIEFALSDGRVVQVRHPDQVVVTRRHVIFGLAQVKGRSQSLSTPRDNGVAKDWLLVDLLHVVSAEPANGKERRRR